MHCSGLVFTEISLGYAPDAKGYSVLRDIKISASLVQEEPRLYVIFE